MSEISHSKRHQKLIEATKRIMTELDLTSLLQTLIAETCSVVGAQRSTLFLIDAERGQLYSKVFSGSGIQEIRFAVDRGLAGYAARTGETVNIVDAYADPRFNREIDQQTGFRTQALLTMPIRNKDGNIIGVVQVLNKVGGGEFTANDVDELEAFSSLMAISIENALAYEKLHRTMKAFELFVPPKYLKRITREGIERIRLGEAETCEASVLFLDIRSFTTLAEGLEPNEITGFLNDYLAEMNDIIQAHNGAIDKYLGDGFMAIFDHKHADDAVQAALDIQRHLIRFNETRRFGGQKEILVGMGISSGNVVIGTVGSVSRMDSTSIGNPVSVAKRVETLTKLYHTRILISQSTFHALADPGQYKIREVDSIRVKGRETPEVIYEVYDFDDKATVESKDNAYPFLLSGISFYKAREWDKALLSLTRSLDAYPDDPVAARYMERCIFFKRNPPEASWDGIVSPDQENFLVYRVM